MHLKIIMFGAENHVYKFRNALKLWRLGWRNKQMIAKINKLIVMEIFRQLAVKTSGV